MSQTGATQQGGAQAAEKSVPEIFTAESQSSRGEKQATNSPAASIFLNEPI